MLFLTLMDYYNSRLSTVTLVIETSGESSHQTWPRFDLKHTRGRKMFGIGLRVEVDDYGLNPQPLILNPQLNFLMLKYLQDSGIFFKGDAS